MNLKCDFMVNGSIPIAHYLKPLNHRAHKWISEYKHINLFRSYKGFYFLKDKYPPVYHKATMVDIIRNGFSIVRVKET